jgi:hypothetical protein
VCLGLGGRRKHTHTTRQPDPAGSDVDSRRGQQHPSHGRRRGRRAPTLKDGISTTPGPSPPGSSSRIRPEQAARPATPRPRPAAPQRHQLGLWPQQLNSSVGSASGRPGQALADHTPFFEANSASVHADTATSGFGSSKGGRGVPLTKQEGPRTARPTEPRNSYASGIRIPHSSPLHEATHAR